MMKEYLLLQFKMLNRRMIDFGLPLLIAYLLIPVFFVLLSNYLFSKTTFASYLYILIALGFVSKLSEYKRNDFLRSIYNKREYLKLRAIENLFCSIPFLIFLVYKEKFLFAILLSVLTICIALFKFRTNLNFTIPTPFGKKPFEFTIGFRKTFFVFPIAYVITYAAIKAENFNLGAFSLFLVAILCFSYYSQIEKKYFVWSFKLSSREFLHEKIKICLLNFTILSIPIVIALSIAFYKELALIMLFLVLCYAYLSTIILAKYSVFPNEMNISHGLLISISFIFPPMLLVVIPYYYSQSVKKLNTVLE